MNFKTFKICLLFFLIGAAKIVVHADGSGPAVLLEWKEKPRNLERGRVGLKFQLLNTTTKVFKTKSWILQTGRGDFPNVIIYAKATSEEGEVHAFNPAISIGQIPVVDKEIPPNHIEQIFADVLVSVPEGKYSVWAVLRGDNSIKTEQISIEVKGGEIVVPDRK